MLAKIAATTLPSAPALASKEPSTSSKLLCKYELLPISFTLLFLLHWKVLVLRLEVRLLHEALFLRCHTGFFLSTCHGSVCLGSDRYK